MSKKTSCEYKLLAATDILAAKCHLIHAEKYVFHFTLKQRIGSIKTKGLDPSYESEDSRYAIRNCEPGDAMRYCFKLGLPVGYSTAISRSQRDGEYVTRQEDVVLLRAPANALLSRSFGLDHSNADVTTKTPDQVTALIRPFSLAEFIDIVQKTGVISCYEIIPPSELEICIQSEYFLYPESGKFSAL